MSWSAAVRGARWRVCWYTVRGGSALRPAVRHGGHARRGLDSRRDARAAAPAVAFTGRTPKVGDACGAQAAAAALLHEEKLGMDQREADALRETRELEMTR